MNLSSLNILRAVLICLATFAPMRTLGWFEWLSEKKRGLIGRKMNLLCAVMVHEAFEVSIQEIMVAEGFSSPSGTRTLSELNFRDAVFSLN